mmetsp:Transcript_16224/g.32041  ORF Transcript_16224/g.32041 Transcript_16224/m.32041 type:complete len:210 (-) Transcript_16224:332-961(-)
MPRAARASKVSSQMSKLRTSSGSRPSSSLSSTGPGRLISSGSSLPSRLSVSRSSWFRSSSPTAPMSSAMLILAPNPATLWKSGLPPPAISDQPAKWARPARAPTAARSPNLGAIPTENAPAGTTRAARHTAATVTATNPCRGRIPYFWVLPAILFPTAAAAPAALPSRECVSRLSALCPIPARRTDLRALNEPAASSPWEDPLSCKKST